MSQHCLLVQTKRCNNRRVVKIIIGLTGLLALAVVAVATWFAPAPVETVSNPEPILVGALNPQPMGPSLSPLTSLDRNFRCDSMEALTPAQLLLQEQYVNSHHFVKQSDDDSFLYVTPLNVEVAYYADNCTFQVFGGANVIFFDAQGVIDPDAGTGQLPGEWFATQPCTSLVPPKTDNPGEPVSAWCVIDPAA